MNLGDTAVRYAKRGLPVFPVKGKLPLTEHGFKDASTDADTIRRWFERWPDANVAIPTGPASGLVVLDVDPRHKGDESLATLEEKHGPLPLTLEARTGGGGRHIFFALRQGQEIRNSAGKLGPGLDVRGDGGYIVAPPSIHPETKQPYVWTYKTKPAQAPPWLIQKLVTVTVTGQSVSSAPIPPGQRNDTLTRIAGAMRRKGCTPEAIEAALLAENARRCNPPLPESEVHAIAQSVSRYAPAPGAEEHELELESDCPALPEFPKAAWRGLFSQYRDEMRQHSEAPDVSHFLTMWTAAGNALGRRVYFPYGMRLCANVYGIVFGPTGDFKTSACRRGAEMAEQAGFRVVRGIGSGEGIASGLSEEPTLFFLEEFTGLLRQGKWEGSTLLSTLTEIFDCPEKYEREYRKNPISLNRPVCSILAGTTEAWFWRDVKEIDFEGGFGNRFIYLTGPPNQPVAFPGIPNVQFAIDAISELKMLREQAAYFDPKAKLVWERFYNAWRKEQFAPLEGAATKRIPSYAIKLAMTYASLEQTLPEILEEQLKAAILVGNHAAKCARHLIGARFSGANAFRELEKRILSAVTREPRETTTKRSLYRALARHYQNSEQFNRVFESMVRAGNLYTKSGGQGRVHVTTLPFD